MDTNAINRTPSLRSSLGKPMRHHLTFSFDELPLVIRDGFNAAQIAGEAEIAYFAADDFLVGTISLDGFRRCENKLGHDRKQIVLANDEPLAIWIKHRLENACRQMVADAIEDDINEREDAEADTLADYRLSLRREDA